MTAPVRVHACIAINDMLCTRPWPRDMDQLTGHSAALRPNGRGMSGLMTHHPRQQKRKGTKRRLLITPAMWWLCSLALYALPELCAGPKAPICQPGSRFSR